MSHQAGHVLEHLTFEEIIMEMAILVIGIGAVAVWFFYGKDGRKE
ncbi:MAG: hypothetical protein ABI167_08565 [Nitrosospira sp.]